MNMKKLIKTGLVGAMTLAALWGSAFVIHAEEQNNTYLVDEYYMDQATGESLQPRTTVILTGEDNYEFNTVADLNNLFSGYTYVGYSFESVYGNTTVHEGGQTALLTGIPKLTLKSDRGVSIYDVKMFWQVEEIQRVTLSYNSGGGVGVMDNQETEKGEAVTIKGNEFTNGNQRFVGWSIQDDNRVDAADRNYQPGSRCVVNEDTVLYAVWENAETVVHFHSGRTDDPFVTMNKPDFDINVNKGGTFQAPAGFEAYETVPGYEGMHDLTLFLGWTSAVGGTEVEYNVGDLILAGDNEMDFYAVWGSFTGSMVAGQDNIMYDLGETASYWMEFRAMRTGRNDVPLYDYVQNMSFLQSYVQYQTGTLKVYVNGVEKPVTLVKGSVVNGRENYSFTLPVIKPGDVVRTELKAKVQRSFSGGTHTVIFGADGVTFKPKARASKVIAEPKADSYHFESTV